MSVQELKKALIGGKGEIDDWLEASSEDEVRAAILALADERKLAGVEAGRRAEAADLAAMQSWAEGVPQDRQHWRRVWAGQAMQAYLNDDCTIQHAVKEAFRVADDMIAADGGFGGEK